MTIGEVNAVLYFVVIGAAALWAAIVALGLLFPARVRRSEAALLEKPGRLLANGVAIGVLGAGAGIALLNAPNGLVKLFGWLLISGIALLSTLGAAGLARVVAGRIGQLDLGQSEFTALWRGAGLLVLAGLFPAFGWFLLFPLQLFAGIGAGMAALGKNRGESAAAIRAEPLG